MTYTLRVTWDAKAPGWLAEVLHAGRCIDATWCNSRRAARKWFAENYSPRPPSAP